MTKVSSNCQCTIHAHRFVQSLAQGVTSPKLISAVYRVGGLLDHPHVQKFARWTQGPQHVVVVTAKIDLRDTVSQGAGQQGGKTGALWRSKGRLLRIPPPAMKGQEHSIEVDMVVLPREARWRLSIQSSYCWSRRHPLSSMYQNFRLPGRKQVPP